MKNKVLVGQPTRAFSDEDKDNNAKERIIDNFLNNCISLDHHNGVFIEELDEARKPYDFYSNTLYVVAGCTKEETGKLAEIVIEVEKDGDILSKSIKTT
jgi:hypothetical protein